MTRTFSKRLDPDQIAPAVHPSNRTKSWKSQPSTKHTTLGETTPLADIACPLSETACPRSQVMSALNVILVLG